MASKSVIARSGEGEALWIFGGLFEIKISSEMSGGELVVVHITAPPNAVIAPPHAHGCAETLSILEGNLRLHVENKTADCGPGTTLYYPKGTWEWAENVTNKPAKLIVSYAPGDNMDAMFREIGTPATSRDLPPQTKAPPDFNRIAAIAKKYGMELKPPAREGRRSAPALIDEARALRRGRHPVASAERSQ